MSLLRLLTSFVFMAVSSPALAQTVWVNSALDGPPNAAPPTTLRDAITFAGPGSNIRFTTGAFPAGSVTDIPLGAALPNVATAGLDIQGEGRVGLDGAGVAAALPGLHITADTVTVGGLEIHDFAGPGIAVTGTTDVVVGDTNYIWGNGAEGIVLVSDGVLAPVDASITNNEIGRSSAGVVNGNCQLAVGACAGISIEDAAFGTAVEDNLVVDTQNGGDGIAVFGVNTTVVDNLVGTDGAGAALGNGGDGILVQGSGSGPSQYVVVDGNVVADSGQHGILLGPASFGATLRGNHVGVDVSGAAIPNQGDGVRVFGSDAHVIGGDSTLGEGNAISANGGAGVSIFGAFQGNWSSDVAVRGNVIGADPGATLARPNGAHGVFVGGSGGGHEIGGATPNEGNVISGNVLAGVQLTGPYSLVQYNLIGTTGDGLAVLVNGGDGIGITGQADPAGSLVSDNLVSGNLGHGIWIHSSGTLVTGHVVQANLIGTDATGLAALPNLLAGVRVTGASLNLIGEAVVGDGLGNTIAGNLGNGVVIEGNDCSALPNCWNAIVNEVRGNAIGLPAASGGVGNGLNGVLLNQTATRPPASANLIEWNSIYSNGERGIWMRASEYGAGHDANEVTRNVLHDNYLCGFLRDEGLGNVAPVPEIVAATSSQIDGTIDNPAIVDRIEVYTDTDFEAEVFLGEATMVGNSWTLGGSGFPTNVDEVRALAITTGGATSGLSPTPGDHCEPVNCDDGEECTYEYYDFTTFQCVPGNRPAGWRCDDGNACTGIINGSDYLPDVCDGAGQCISGPNIDPAADCPFASDCNDPICNPNAGCVYREVDTDGICSPADLDIDKNDNNDCEPNSECDPDLDGMGGEEDLDWDGLPDDWETLGLDTDCSGAVDTQIAGIDVFGSPYSADLNSPEIFIELDYMALACGPLPGPVDDDPHNHFPHTDWVDEIVTRFSAIEGVDVIIDVDDCIPEAALITPDEEITSGDPDCGVGDVTNMDDLAARYFTPERRGVYHYAVMGHGAIGRRTSDDVWTDAHLDGVCTGLFQVGGFGEIPGDNFVVAKDFDPNGLEDDAAAGSTFMHELGHNLGLEHGGVGDSTNFKPNYQSRMNYRYGLDCVNPAFCVGVGMGAVTERYDQLNYSREALPNINEVGVNELVGLSSGFTPVYNVRWYCSSGGQRAGAADGLPLDYDCNGLPGNFAASVDLDGNGALEVLHGSQDWGSLVLPHQCADNARADRADAVADEFDQSETTALRLGSAFTLLLDEVVDVSRHCVENAVPIGGTGDVEVVLYGSADLQVDQVVLPSVSLHGASVRQAAILDENADGVDDIVLTFSVPDIWNLSDDATQAYLHGRLTSSREFSLSDAIVRLPASDNDGDGVDDACDECLNSPPGTVVDEMGCP